MNKDIRRDKQAGGLTAIKAKKLTDFRKRHRLQSESEMRHVFNVHVTDVCEVRVK